MRGGTSRCAPPLAFGMLRVATVGPGSGEPKYTNNERWGMVVWKTREMEHTWSNMYVWHVYGMHRRRRNFFPMTKKCSQNPGFRVHLS